MARSVFCRSVSQWAGGAVRPFAISTFHANPRVFQKACSNHSTLTTFSRGFAAGLAEDSNPDEGGSTAWRTAAAAARTKAIEYTLEDKTVDSKTRVTTTRSLIRTFKPTTPSLRHTQLIDKRELWRGGPVRELTVGIRKKAGRNGFGHITVRHRGGGHKRRYRFIDFKRDMYDQKAVVQRFEHDPNRSAFIALVAYEDGTVSYIIAPARLVEGDTIMSSREPIEVKVGNAMTLENIPLGIPFHNMEVRPGMGAQIARSAGTSCVLIEKNTAKEGYALVNICSKEQRFVKLGCMGTIGVVSNEQHHLVKLGKAGRSRWLGRRPSVRGVAMNPVDHPMGGGEGRSSGGRPSCSPKGLLAKGFRTVKKVRNRNILVHASKHRRGGR